MCACGACGECGRECRDATCCGSRAGEGSWAYTGVGVVVVDCAVPDAPGAPRTGTGTGIEEEAEAGAEADADADAGGGCGVWI